MSRRKEPTPSQAALNEKQRGKLEEDVISFMPFDELQEEEKAELRPRITVGFDNASVTYLALTENELAKTKPKQRGTVAVKSFEAFSEEEQTKITLRILAFKKNDKVVDIKIKCIFDDLPEEMILLIFSMLDPDDLLSIGSTSKKFRRIANDRSLWDRPTKLALKKIYNNEHWDLSKPLLFGRKDYLGIPSLWKVKRKRKDLLNKKRELDNKEVIRSATAPAGAIGTAYRCCSLCTLLIAAGFFFPAASYTVQKGSSKDQAIGIALYTIGGAMTLLLGGITLLLNFKARNRFQYERNLDNDLSQNHELRQESQAEEARLLAPYKRKNNEDDGAGSGVANTYGSIN